MGDDTIYSGTVAAATEGYLLGVPSFAISLTSQDGRAFRDGGAAWPWSWSSGTSAARPGRGCSTSTCPTCRARTCAGYRITRLGRRHKAEKVIKAQNPRGETVYWVGAAGAARDAGEGTDFHAVEAGYVSVTPLQIDLTNREQMAGVADWLACAERGDGDRRQRHAQRHRHDVRPHARAHGRAPARRRHPRRGRARRR